MVFTFERFSMVKKSIPYRGILKLTMLDFGLGPYKMTSFFGYIFYQAILYKMIPLREKLPCISLSSQDTSFISPLVLSLSQQDNKAEITLESICCGQRCTLWIRVTIELCRHMYNLTLIRERRREMRSLSVLLGVLIEI